MSKTKPGTLIYIPIWLDLLFRTELDIVVLRYYLHSNMVRFIMRSLSKKRLPTMLFTFQYGQIYYWQLKDTHLRKKYIYIPIWLDLLSSIKQQQRFKKYNLHSNMVRFIIDYFTTSLPKQILFTFQYGQIYYPTYYKTKLKEYINLHSNMVRFIIIFFAVFLPASLSFTFQYGQIYYYARK